MQTETHFDNIQTTIIEFNGRDQTGSGKLTQKITDFEILKLFWEDFLTSEGVSRVEIKKVQPSTDEIKRIVQDFLSDK